MNRLLIGVAVILLWQGFAEQTFAQERHRPLARVSKFLFGEPTQPRHTPRNQWGNSYSPSAAAIQFDGRQLPLLRHDDSAGRFPKYYGGFHSSHFSNIGVPGGDKGFRGNGVYWAPW